MKEKKESLYNKKSRDILKKELIAEPFKRRTVSFYKYYFCKNPQTFRDSLYRDWDKIKVFGRIYVSKEGINAQLSVPENHWCDFLNTLNNYTDLINIPLKRAYQEGSSFYKLTIKVREELVAFGIPEHEYSMERVGNHLSAQDFNRALENPNTIIVDMRNYYESEIGRFKQAIVPKVENSKKLLPTVNRILAGHKNAKVLLYCTGGIRCEKASAYLMQQGFKDVNQLRGGIIQYAHEVAEKKLKSKFIGKNFVFDERLGERITDDVIAECHICGTPCDDHTDCNNNACHILFIQCRDCAKNLNGCCSEECQKFALLPEKEQRKLRKDPEKVVSKTFFYKQLNKNTLEK